MVTNTSAQKINSRNFQALCDLIVKDMSRLRVPGVSVAAYHRGCEYSAGFGITSVENPLPVTPDTLFQVGSISKTFTGTLLMRLVDQGRLDLDLPVRTYLPELRLADRSVAARVTTRHLLTHVGGWVGDYFNDFGNGDDALASMVASLVRLPQVTPLGKIWSYNNAGFNIAARLVEVLTCKSYEQAAQELLLDPLGLHMTFFFPSDILITHRFVAGHHRAGRNIRVSRPWAIGRAGAGVGGVVSTVRDLLTYARFHMGDGRSEDGRRLLKQKTLAAMRLPQADAGDRGKIGITWFIRQAGGLAVFSHGGATHGQQAGFYFIPQAGFALAILTNSDDGGVLTDNALKWALDIYFDVALPQPRPIQTPAWRLKEFAGHYELPLSAFDLKTVKGQLVLHDIPRWGFPTPDSPPGEPMPPIRFAFFDTDQVIGLDEPMKGACGDFFRDANGRLRYFRLGGRVHKKVT